MDQLHSLNCAHRELPFAAAAGCDLGLSLVPLFSPSHQSIQDESNVRLGERALIMVGPTLATNLLSTGLIAWKAWYALLASNHRPTVSDHAIGIGNTAPQ